jgi:thioredoxin reductase
MANLVYDVVIVGGGPAGLSAALALGRGRKRVLLCDAGPRRNAAAVRVHNFVTRDGTFPSEFRRIAREQLTSYPNVQVVDTRVEEIDGARGGFRVRLATVTVTARRVLLCTGMIDELPEIEGFRALWGTSIFACPYCHGWEVQDRRFGCLATTPDMLTFAMFLRGWTSDVVVLTNDALEVPEELRTQLALADVRIERRRIARLVAHGNQLQRVEFDDGDALERDVLFAHPAQRQIELVHTLGLALDEKGFVRVDDARETSVAGIYAAGDLTSPAQSAVLAAAAGMFAAAALNRALTVELVTSRQGPAAAV